MTKYLAAALLTTALFTCTASAQTANKIAAADSAAATASSHKEGEWRASKLVGVNVYNDANEKIGDINDVILDKSGKVENIILGVGGFLGMGEKDVAVPFNAVQVTSKDNNKWYLVMNSTKDALKAAKGFKYDRDAMTWMPEDAPATTGTPARRPNR